MSFEIKVSLCNIPLYWLSERYNVKVVGCTRDAGDGNYEFPQMDFWIRPYFTNSYLQRNMDVGTGISYLPQICTDFNNSFFSWKSRYRVRQSSKKTGSINIRWDASDGIVSSYLTPQRYELSPLIRVGMKCFYCHRELYLSE